MKDVLSDLGDYRNAITHFGIDKSQEMDNVYNIVFESFGIILYEFLDELSEVDEYFTYDDVIDIFEPWYEAGIDFQREACVQNSKRKISIFTNILKEVMHSQKLKNFMNAYDITIDEHFSDYDTDEIHLDFWMLESYISVVAYYSPYFNYTFFCDVETMEIWFVVDHYNDKVYVYKDEAYYNPEKERKNMISEDIGVHCEEKPLTENRIRNIIIERLRTSYELLRNIM